MKVKMKMESMKTTTFFVLLIFILGMMNFPQVSLTYDYPSCRKVGDCYPGYCPPISIRICFKHHCVCIRANDLQAPTSTPNIK
nr:hypothetical protein CTI12_AA273090 [Tanacetum cinerariifolium]